MAVASVVTVEATEWDIYMHGQFVGTVRYDGREELPEPGAVTPARPDPWQVLWYPTPGQDFVPPPARSAALGVTLLRALTEALRAYGVVVEGQDD